MKIEKIEVGYLNTNCYIVSIDNQVLVIDPGDEYKKIEKLINNREVVGVIVTHYHHDHIGALKSFKSNLIFDKHNLQEEINKIGPFTFEVIYTPGHREDAITIYFKENKVMFVGDFIFKGTIGRTDLETGSMVDMEKSITKIKKYDDDIILYPGHGETTTLGNEKRLNPYF